MSSPLASIPRALYRACEVGQLDRIAIGQFGISGFALMQRAGKVCLEVLLERWPGTQRLVVLAGAGNNGGDACIVAREARDQGLQVDLVVLHDPPAFRDAADLAWQRALAGKVTVHSLADFSKTGTADRPGTVLVDGLLGTGLDRDVVGDCRAAIDWLNGSDAPVLAIDVPSGLNADTGMPMAAAVVADVTVSFIGMKQGLLTGVAGNYTGSLLFSDLDVPPQVYSHALAPLPAATRIDIVDASRQIRPRAPAAHKAECGHAVVIGGDFGFGGAALMAAEAAARAGAGLVTVVTRSRHRAAMLARRPELMVFGTEDGEGDSDSLLALLLSKASVLVVGPGLGQGEWSRANLRTVLAAQRQHGIPMVVDADGLNLLAQTGPGQDGTEGSGATDNWLLTPHPGEAARLLGCDSREVTRDRFAAVQQLQHRWGGHCLLKGHGSLLVSPEDPVQLYLCSEGNAGMATAGMGDVLAGLIGGLLAQGLAPGCALRAAVCIHGEAADLAAQSGQRGLLATDLLPLIRQLVNIGC